MGAALAEVGAAPNHKFRGEGVEMKRCPYCSAKINEQFNFCVECEQQVKCIACGNHLLPGKSKCLICGTSIMRGIHPSSSLNEYSFEEEQEEGTYKRQIYLKFSDVAIDKAGQYLARYIQPWPPREVIGPGTEVTRTAPALEAGPEPSVEAEVVPASTVAPQPAQQPSDEYDWVDTYTFKDGDRLEIKLVDFKGKTKAEQKRRLVLLYVWGYNRHFGQPVPSRSPMIQLAKDKKLWDNTFSHQITRMRDDVLIESDDGIRLSPGAKAEVDKVLRELQDGGLKGYDYQAVKPPRKTSRRGRKSKAALEAIQSQVDQWIAAEVDLGSFDVRQLQTAFQRQKVQFGLWVLKKKLGVKNAPLDAVVKYITQEFPTMGGSARSLKDSVTGQTFVGRTPQGERFLTQRGEEDIEALLPEDLKNSERVSQE